MVDHNRSPASALSLLATLSTMTFPDVATAIQTYLLAACTIAGTQTAFIGDVDHTHLHIRAIAPAPVGDLAVGAALPRQQTFCRTVQATAQPFIVPDACHDPRVRDLLADNATPIGAYLGVPIPARTADLTPTLCALHPGPQPFTPSQQAAMTVLAAQLAPWMARLRQADPTPPPAHPPQPHAAHTLLSRIIAHDINNPLNFLQGVLDLWQTDPDLVDATGPDSLLPQAQRAITYIQRLVQDLVDGTAAMTGTLPLVRHTIDLAALIRDIVTIARRDLAAACHLTVRLDPHLPPLVSDRERVWQIIQNLVGNAVRYTPAGTIQVRARTVAHATAIRITIQDAGPGIRPTDLHRIWDVNQRASRVGPGQGLGLAIVRMLVEALGGQVGVASRAGHGSTFWVQLPTTPPPPGTSVILPGSSEH